MEMIAPAATIRQRRRMHHSNLQSIAGLVVLCCLLSVPFVQAQDVPKKDPPPQSWQDIQYYLGAIWIGVWSPTWLFGLGLYVMQRDKQPIRSHSPILVIGTDVILIAWQLLICARGIVGNDYPCWIALWADWVCELGMASVYLMRAWVLYFRHELTYEFLQTSRESIKARLDSQKAPDNSNFDHTSAAAMAALPKQGWFTAHKMWKTRTVLVPFAMFISSILLIPVILFTIQNQYSDDTGATFTASTGWNCNNGPSAVIISIYNIIFIVIFSVLAYQMRLVVDGFGIKADLRFTGVSAGITAIVWLIFKVILTSINNTKFPFSTLVALIFAQAAFSSHTFYPLWRTYYRPPVIETSSSAVDSDVSSLRGILTAPKSFAVFQQFLSQEFCVENLLFWNDVEQFKSPETSMADEGTVWKLGRDIFAKYIRPGASLEVNIPSEMRNEIIDYFNKNGPTGKEKQKVNGVAGAIVPERALTIASNAATPPPPDQKSNGAGAAGSGGESAPPLEKRRSALGFTSESDANSSDSFAKTAAAAVAAAGPRPSVKPSLTVNAGAEIRDKLASEAAASGSSTPGSPTASGTSPLLSSVSGGGAAAAFIVNIEPYPCQKVFQVAQDNIFALMESDPYQRFKYSDLYRVMCAQMEMDSRKHSALQLVKMT